MSLFSLFILNKFRHQLNSSFQSNSFNYYDDDIPDDYNDNIYSLTERNYELLNYRNSCKIRMQNEEKFSNNLFSMRNKLAKFKNDIRESELEFDNTRKKYEYEEDIQAKKYASDLVDIIKKKQIEELKKKKYLENLDSEINNENEKIKKKLETKKLNKKLKQNELLKEMENENKIKLLKYKKEKEIEKEEKEREYQLKKLNFENENEIQLNDLKNKSNLADKLLYLFKNKFI